MEAPIFSIPGRLEALLHHGYVLPKGAEDEIRLIKRDLEEVVAIIHGQRNKNLEEHAMVVWTKQVRELSYDIEDFIDQYEHAAGSQSWSIRRIPSRKIIYRHRRKTTPRLPSNLRQRLWMANKIREFSVRVQEVLQRYSEYNLGGAAGTSASFRTWHPRPSGNDAHPLVGMGAATNKLEWLLGMHDAEQQKLKVVSIVGFGGVGKTTLANEFYRKVGQQFECRAFIRMSRKPDMRRIFISMLSQVRPHLPADNWKLHSLISTIRTYLQDKRYLIIIDDLWAMSTWDIIKYALPENNSGSRIITTTEIEEVALQSCGYDSKYVFKMKPLNADDSRELFFSTVFGPRECPPELKEVSSDIIRKCGGLPLAIVIIASLLASQLDIKEQWDNLNNSLSHILMTNSAWEGMKQVLNLSYDNLPQNLKVCMLYMSMYPEGNIMLKGDLVNQWIAEGFICATEGEDREEISRTCFDELVGQNLIQPVHRNDNGDVLSCIIHPMVLNFIITYKSIEENVVTAIHHSEANITLADKIRRLSLHFGNADDATPPTNMRLSQVRTLGFFGVFKCMPPIVEFRLIQVLMLHVWGDEGVISLNLTRISELFRLRYLMVSSNLTLELPTHMSGVQNLETLKIDARVSAVPSDIVHLPGLLHLSLPAETNLPNGFSHLTSLQTLEYFDLSSNSTDNVRSLGSLTNLQDLQLTCCAAQEPGNLKSNMQFLLMRSILGELSNLKSLTLAPKSSDSAKSPDDAGPTSIISGDDFKSTCSPPNFLWRLELSPRICIFSYLPKCLTQLDKLCILKIGVGKIVSNGLEILRGLPNLNVLSIYIHTKPAERIVIGKTGFSVLKCFKFKCCDPLLEFEPDAMPSLRRLKLCFNSSGTSELSTLPVGINHLANVKEVCAKIGRARPDATYRAAAEAALKEAMSSGGHATCPRVNVQCANQMFGFMEHRNSLPGKEKSETPKQHEILGKNTVESEDNFEEVSDDNDVSFELTNALNNLQEAQLHSANLLKALQDVQDIRGNSTYITELCSGIARSIEAALHSLQPHRSSQGSPPIQARQGTSFRKVSGERMTVTQLVGNTDPLSDGYMWRKYGQKDILGSQYPRSYFRCAHRSSDGCPATKQVQLRDGDPSTYEVTYRGSHTCRTSTTPLLTMTAPAATNTVTTNSPTSSAAILAQDHAMVTTEHATAALSTPIQLDISCVPSSLVGAGSSSGSGEGSSAQGNVATTGTEGVSGDRPHVPIGEHGQRPLFS